MSDTIDKILQAFRDLTTRWDPTGHLWIEDIWFERILFAGQRVLEEKLRQMPRDRVAGFMFEDLPARTRTWLEKNRISYITDTGYAAIHLKSNVFLVRPDTRPLTRPILEARSGHVTGKARPSRFINPTSLNVFDVLIRVTPEELAAVSGLAFSTSFGFSQSALSKIMSSVSTPDLVALRKLISRLGPSWWLDSMLAPRTGRGMTPFYHLAQEYRMHGQDLDRKGVEKWVHHVHDRYPDSILPGPLEVAKMLGVIFDRTATFWVDPKIVAEMKREFKLVPVRAGEEPVCAIAVPKSDFSKEAITSAAPNIGAFALPSTMLSLNLFRVVWDLGFSDSRAKEARKSIMELIINAV